MLIAVSPEKIQLPLGTIVRFPGTWKDYQALGKLLGESPLPKVKYRTGEILLMSPISPAHGRKAALVAKIIDAVLSYLDKPNESFTPITIKLPEISGFEPDYCFYIDNYEFAVGRDCIDWETDPPPDLAVEVDVTSYTDIADYLPYRIPEVWLIKGEGLIINQYQEDSQVYIEVEESMYFPSINIKQAIAYCFFAAKVQPSSLVMQELKKMLSRNEFRNF